MAEIQQRTTDTLPAQMDFIGDLKHTTLAL